MADFWDFYVITNPDLDSFPAIDNKSHQPWFDGTNGFTSINFGILEMQQPVNVASSDTRKTSTPLYVHRALAELSKKESPI